MLKNKTEKIIIFFIITAFVCLLLIEVEETYFESSKKLKNFQELLYANNSLFIYNKKDCSLINTNEINKLNCLFYKEDIIFNKTINQDNELNKFNLKFSKIILNYFLYYKKIYNIQINFDWNNRKYHKMYVFHDQEKYFKMIQIHLRNDPILIKTIINNENFGIFFKDDLLVEIKYINGNYEVVESF